MKKISYLGNDWIGMFIRANNEYALVPVDSNKKMISSVEENLKVTCIKTTIGNTNLIGSFVVMNSNGIILPNITTKEEVSKIKETGLNVYVTKSNHNSNGNNIVVNDKGGIHNPEIDKKEIKKIEDVLGVEMDSMKIAEHGVVGSCSIANNRGALINYRSTPKELEMIKDLLKVPAKRGTINMGTPFPSIGAVANDNGYVVGRLSSAYEMGGLEEALDYIK